MDNDHPQTHMHSDSRPAHLDATEARSAVKNTGLRYVLFISLTLVVIAMIIMWMWGSAITG